MKTIKCFRCGAEITVARKVKSIVCPKCGLKIGFAATKPITVQRKPERNALCPCGSGKKYKKCCGFAQSDGTDLQEDTSK